ncbi:hypothetical protein AVCANL279_08980, partial [Campylobacter canadensis]|uniref:flagellin hook IN motif-containing protein n=2 Tax=Campylobacter canadensis TaxID=449520 RepID=UPI00295E29F8
HNVRAKDLPADGKITLTFKNVDGINDVTLEPVQLTDKGDIMAGGGLGALVEVINKSTDKTGIKASVSTISVFESPIKEGTTGAGFSINGVKIGSVAVKDKDGNNALVSAINAVTDQTGVKASVDSKGRLTLANNDGRGIQITDGDYVEKQPSLGTSDVHNVKVLIKNADEGGKADTELTTKDLDFMANETWTTGMTANVGGEAPDKDSLFNTYNTFEDIKALHSNIDKGLKVDGYNAALALKDTKGNGGINLSNLTITAKGALNIALKKPDGIDKDNLDFTDAEKRITSNFALLKDNERTKTVDAANKLIDNILTDLKSLVKAGENKTMDTKEAQRAILSHAYIQYFEGLKEGLNSGIDVVAGVKMTDDATKGITANNVNMGRLSLSSNNGRDIVVDVKDSKGVNLNSAIGFDKNVTEKTISLRETNSTITKED